MNETITTTISLAIDERGQVGVQPKQSTRTVERRNYRVLDI